MAKSARWLPIWQLYMVLYLCLTAGLTEQATAQGTVHALYVGVADYQFGKPANPRGSFENLNAAPNDIATIRQAIETRARRTGVALAEPETLLGPDATRAAVLNALGQYASGAKGEPGDTLLFYFTGHGARFFDTLGDQSGRYNSTIVPYDARNPAEILKGNYGDILDRELRDYVDAISARGITVVTIFDSCNSGTATRGLVRPSAHAKAAPSVHAAAPQNKVRFPQPPSGVSHGNVIHLAGAVDGSESVETPTDASGKLWLSDFTRALATAILQAPSGASYADIFSSARIALSNSGSTQEPQDEGSLYDPFLGELRKGPPVLTASKGEGGTYVLDGGTLGGATPGSRYGLFRTLADALDPNAKAMAEATVASADAWHATLQPETTVGDTTLFAREQARSFSGGRLRVKFIGGSSAERAALAPSLANSTYFELTDANAAYGVRQVGDVVRIYNDHDVQVGSDIPAHDQARFDEAMQKLARYHALLALAGGSHSLPVSLAVTEQACGSGDKYPVRMRNGSYVFSPGDRFYLTVENKDPARSLYFYLLLLDDSDHSVTPVDPPPFAELQLGPGACYSPRRLAGHADSEGVQHLLLIASSLPLPSLPQAVAQGGLRGEPFRQPTNPLEALIQSAAGGLRSPSAPVWTGDWDTRLITMKVTSPKS